MPERGQFTAGQREVLLRPIMANRVSKDGKGFSHVESYEIEAHLTRIFGFEGWDKFLRDLTVIFEEKTTLKNNKEGWNVCYRATVRLEAYSPDGRLAKVSEDASSGDATQPSRADAHDLALKSAVSLALKRAAKGLGDQFGLSLYDGGSMDPLVKKVVPYGAVKERPEPLPDPALRDEALALQSQGVVDSPPASRTQQTKLRAKLHEVGVNDNDDVHQWCSAKLRREITSLNSLSTNDADFLIDAVDK